MDPLNLKVHTFGCKVNTYDSGLLQKSLAGFTWQQEPQESAKPFVHVLNTCAVTAEASREAVRLVRRIKAKDPFATVVVTGCAAQVDTELFQNLPGVDLVVANSHKGLLPFILEQHFKRELSDKVFKSNIFRKEDLEAGGGTEAHHSRAFLKIQDGCNSFCAFCIIPYARGKSRSIPRSELVKRVNELVTQGYQEVVLTGVHIGDYDDGKLSDLVADLLGKTAVKRLRLSSLEPIEIDEDLLQLYSDERLCPHFHMSIQSAETATLHAMKRKYSETEVREKLFEISERVPNVFIGMDVIAGFPTETAEQFERCYQVLAETPWTRLHVFPYSERKGTRAAVLPQLAMSERKWRARRLRELSQQRVMGHALKQVGAIKQVLPRKTEDVFLKGLSRDYWNVQSAQPWTSGRDHEVKIRITAVEFSEQLSSEALLIGSPL